MDVHPPKNGINWYWSIPISTWTSKNGNDIHRPATLQSTADLSGWWSPSGRRWHWAVCSPPTSRACPTTAIVDLFKISMYLNTENMCIIYSIWYKYIFIVCIYIYIYTCIIYCILLIIIIYRQSMWPKIPHEHSWVPGYGPCKRLARHFVGEWNPSLKC